ncbi:MAG: formimidoylglutamase [candidate division Zixibacteria bacterium]|nr:formimidoylglutamase [candidate division Zixibacteria bacterium]
MFGKSPDSDDRKMGDLVSGEASDYDDAEIIIIGCPQDEGVRRNNGRVGAAAAPDKIRQLLYQLTSPPELTTGRVVDLGNIKIADTLEETHEIQAKVVAEIIGDKKRLIVLGGGNDISYPDCLGLSKVHKSILALNIDSHFDVRENEVRNSGTPYRQLLEENIIRPENFFELAIQPFANSEIYWQYLKSKGVSIHTLEQLRQQGIEKTLRSILDKNKADAIFWGFDIDSVRSADAPGVSASYSTGLTSEEILSIAAIAGRDARSKILEISEVNPTYDIDNRTAKLAAQIVIRYLCSL